jgi:hypothetical protein
MFGGRGVHVDITNLGSSAIQMGTWTADAFSSSGTQVTTVSSGMNDVYLSPGQTIKGVQAVENAAAGDTARWSRCHHDCDWGSDWPAESVRSTVRDR